MSANRPDLSYYFANDIVREQHRKGEVTMPRKPSQARIYEVWNELDAAIVGVLETFPNAMLLFFASNNVAEVNRLVAEAAQNILAEREVAYH